MITVNFLYLIFNRLLVISIFVFFLIPFLFIVIGIKLSSKGPIIHWSKRVGRNNVLFSMPKFRTLEINAPDVATHLLTDYEKYSFQFGNFLRKTSIDEIPQLWSVFNGHMNFVGPRPALHNQEDLIKLRTDKSIHLLKPGITGWAQVNGRDELSIERKVELDFYYLKKKSFFFDLYIIALTVINVIRKNNINH